MDVEDFTVMKTIKKVLSQCLNGEAKLSVKNRCPTGEPPLR
jgi:hypothetical protein